MLKITMPGNAFQERNFYTVGIRYFFKLVCFFSFGSPVEEAVGGFKVTGKQLYITIHISEFILQTENMKRSGPISYQNPALFSSFTSFKSLRIHRISYQNYAIPHVMPHAIPQTHSVFFTLTA